MLIRRERPWDIEPIRAVTAAAFGPVPHSAPSVEPDGAPGEATLVGWLRDDPGWVPELSLVAQSEPADTAAAGNMAGRLAGNAAGDVVGHVVATRGMLGGRPALGLGPLSVHPTHQRRGTGAALVHTLLGAADAMGEPVVVLLGDPAYYARFGFVPARTLGIDAPDPAWGDYFQARALSAWDEAHAGRFTYAAPFDRL